MMRAQTPLRAFRQPATPAEYPHPVAFAIQIGRNLMVQGLGMGMVGLMGLTILPWSVVLAWTVLIVAAVAAEHRLLRVIARGDDSSRRAKGWAPILRTFTTSVYALAALALLLEGGPAQHLFAFALMSASAVHVLMRHYRSPRVMVISISPYLLVLAIFSIGLTHAALQQGQPLAALASTFAIAMFTIQVWTARAQLAGAWTELLAARAAAEERERAADAANRAKSQFLTTMSHELRTPLHGVLGMAQALADDPLTRVQHERVNVIRQASEELLAVLNDLLDLSRIEAGELRLEMVEFDLEELARGVVSAYQALAARKGLTFTFDACESVCGRYRGDSARIRRILYALSDNAVKFTDTGGVAVRVYCDADDVVFRIDDTGIGIAQDDLARLFEGFFQADASLSRRFGGAGMGLAICSELAALMGGSLKASSALGQGSSFIVRLPLERAEAAAPLAEAAPDDYEPPELRVLAAEDNPTNQLVLRTLLAPAGIAPTIVVNGREALAAWEEQHWDIVLMDIQMPEMNGIEATRAIRLREVETGRTRTPIVAVTANAMTFQIVEYEAAGMDGVVAKPVDLANLFKVMELALG